MKHIMLFGHFHMFQNDLIDWPERDYIKWKDIMLFCIERWVLGFETCPLFKQCTFY